MNKLKHLVTLLILFAIVTSSPLRVLAIVLEDYDARTFDEFQQQVPKWQNGVPTYEEAMQFLDTIYAESGFTPHYGETNPYVDNSSTEPSYTFASNPDGGVESAPPFRDPVEQVPPSQCPPWRIGADVCLPIGKRIHAIPGLTTPWHTCVPVDNWLVRIIGGPRIINGQHWYNIDRRVLDTLPTSGTGWVAFGPVDISPNCSDIPTIPRGSDIYGPTIQLLSVYATPITGSTNNLAIQARIWDNLNINIASVILTYNGMDAVTQPVSVENYPARSLSLYARRMRERAAISRVVLQSCHDGHWQ